MKKGKTYFLWHKNGICKDFTGWKTRVYKNGKLADTKGKFEQLVITCEPNESNKTNTKKPAR